MPQTIDIYAKASDPMKAPLTLTAAILKSPILLSHLKSLMDESPKRNTRT